MPSVRNPVAGFGITILASAGMAFLAALPILFFPLGDAGLVYFYLPFALFGVGMVSGRSGFLGSLGFVGAMIGGFVGVYAFQLIFRPFGWSHWPTDWTILMNLAFGAACGIGGLAIGKIGHHRIERLTEHAPRMRRCARCGAKVGVAARKCWSCRAYLPPT